MESLKQASGQIYAYARLQIFLGKSFALYL